MCVCVCIEREGGGGREREGESRYIIHVPRVHVKVTAIQPCMVAISNMLSEYTILYGKIMTLVVRI